MEWIIAGGGIHGCTIATYLIKAKGIPASQICIIDPHKGPIEKWKDLTSRIAVQSPGILQERGKQQNGSSEVYK